LGLVADDKTIVDVPALNVIPVVSLNCTTEAEPLRVTVLLPRLIVRVLVVLDTRDVAVTLKLLVVKVPAVMVIELLEVNASARVTETAFIVVAPSVLPEDVIVLLFINVVTRDVYAPPVARVRLPTIFTFVELTVQVLPVQIRLLM